MSARPEFQSPGVGAAQPASAQLPPAGNAPSRTPSAERLQALLNRSPALAGVGRLTVPGSPAQVNGLELSRTPSVGSLSGGVSPRPSGAGGYAPKQRVILAEISPSQPTATSGGAPLDDFNLDTDPSPRPESVVPQQPEAKQAPQESFLRAYVLGTAPALNDKTAGRPLLDFCNCVLRGVGQVMFMNNPTSGLIILLALFWQSVYVATMGVVGVVSSTGTAMLLGLDSGPTHSGLFGFNGLLVGLALGTFDRGCQLAEDCQTGLWEYAGLAVPVVVMAGFSVVFCVSLGNLLAPVWGVPSFTLPFNFAALLFLGTALQSDTFPQPFTPALLPAAVLETGSGSAAEEEVEWLKVLEAVPKGIGQVYLADDTVSGIVITVGLAVCSPISALMAVLGSVLGAAVALCMRVPLGGLYVGLWGYNAVLGCMGVGGMFFYPTFTAFAFAAACAIMCAYMGGLLASVFAPLGLPTMTLPFCLGTLAFALLQDTVPGFVPVALSDVTTPEAHYQAMKDNAAAAAPQAPSEVKGEAPTAAP